MEYPDNCLRGILNDSFLVRGEKKAAPHLFYFNDAPERGDGWKERSINWQDDDDALGFTLSYRDEGSEEFKFKAGVAVLARDEIDLVMRLRHAIDNLKYERQGLEGNPYHGNLLLRAGTPLSVERMIGAALALTAEVIDLT
jgi:hypothetical protein